MSILRRFLILCFLFPLLLQAQTGNKKKVFLFSIDKEIAPAMWRITNKSITEAEKMGADYILIRMNTYGGMLESADSIRTRIMNTRIPTMVFIDNNAASAGALISIACDSIYMRTGASFGAATVVNQTGEAMPDKYQSFMRSMMRATAESHGKDTLVAGVDTTIRWRRNPLIAEAMVDPRTYIPNVNDSGKVLTFTTEEAIRNGYCEGEASSVNEVLQKTGLADVEVFEYKPSTLDKIMGFLMSPILQGILISLIVAGIYFEMQSPGIGFPLIIAITAALLYFSPLYLDGLAENWEILIFIAGLILVALEIFVVPGFGITGISGIICIIVGLTLSMLGKHTFEPGMTVNWSAALRALSLVFISIFVGFIASFYGTYKLIRSPKMPWFALQTEQKVSDGYVGIDTHILTLNGKTGVSLTVLRPSGTVEIEGVAYDAVSQRGFIEKGQPIKVIKVENAQLYVISQENV
jgi:membrane-bound serine protease (ClpP class)